VPREPVFIYVFDPAFLNLIFELSETNSLIRPADLIAWIFPQDDPYSVSIRF
jgi:hypothetical protein